MASISKMINCGDMCAADWKWIFGLRWRINNVGQKNVRKWVSKLRAPCWTSMCPRSRHWLVTGKIWFHYWCLSLCWKFCWMKQWKITWMYKIRSTISKFHKINSIQPKTFETISTFTYSYNCTCNRIALLRICWTFCRCAWSFEWFSSLLFSSTCLLANLTRQSKCSQIALM